MDKPDGSVQEGHLSHQGLTLSTSGVKIMASMEGTVLSCSKGPLADHERPGFKLCSYVERFRETDAGLYGIGEPDRNAEVLVTANFKLTFDHLRKALPDISAWILVLDTKGIIVGSVFALLPMVLVSSGINGLAEAGKYTASGISATDLKAVKINKRQLERIFKKHPDAGLKIMRRMVDVFSSRLSNAYQAYLDLLSSQDSQPTASYG